MVALHLGIYAGIWHMVARLKTPMAQIMRLMAAFNTASFTRVWQPSH
jgi:hypothetical protein